MRTGSSQGHTDVRGGADSGLGPLPLGYCLLQSQHCNSLQFPLLYKPARVVVFVTCNEKHLNTQKYFRIMMLGAEKFMTHNFLMEYIFYHKISFFVLVNSLVVKFYFSKYYCGQIYFLLLVFINISFSIL